MIQYPLYDHHNHIDNCYRIINHNFDNILYNNINNQQSPTLFQHKKSTIYNQRLLMTETPIPDCTTFNNNPLATTLVYILLIETFLALLIIIILYCCCQQQRYKKKANKAIPGFDQYVQTSTCCC